MSPFASRFYVILIVALLGLCQSFHTAPLPKGIHQATSYRLIDSQRSSTVVDRPETVEKVDKKEDVTEKEDRKDAGSWEVRLYNDPFNKREFVARCLATICGKSDTESYQIMMKAHKDGMGVIGVYAFEVAELYYASLQDNGLFVEMVPVGDDE